MAMRPSNPTETTLRRRWTGAAIGIGALCLASAALAFAFAQEDRAWRRSLTVVAEPVAPHVAAPVAVESTEANGLAPALMASPSAPPIATAGLPRPLVLRVEPPMEAAAASARAAPAASSTLSSSAGAPAVALTAAAGAGGAPPAAAASSAPADTGVQCGATACVAGKVCCNASCGLCTSPGESCSKVVCGQPMLLASVSCGRNTCNVGELCCNASCGICVRPGAPCDATRRCSGEITYPESQSCGLQTCNVGLVCCNPSCGICAAPGDACSDRVCG
jgi:hypothetical protein